MRLTDLMPAWVNYFSGGKFQRFADAHSHVFYGEGTEWIETPAAAENLMQADGIIFLCPTCFKKNSGRLGTESVLIWFANRPNVPPLMTPAPRWNATGNGFDNLTLSPSINVENEHWHGWIQNGEIK